MYGYLQYILFVSIVVSTNYPRKINTNQAALLVVSSSAEDTVILMKQGRVTERVTEKEKKILELLLEDPAYTDTAFLISAKPELYIITSSGVAA